MHTPLNATQNENMGSAGVLPGKSGKAKSSLLLRAITGIPRFIGPGIHLGPGVALFYPEPVGFDLYCSGFILFEYPDFHHTLSVKA
jgi:hypothetical protein